MGVSFKVDTSRMKKRVSNFQARRMIARRAVVSQKLENLAERISAHCPRDTNREVRGWMMACEQGGAKRVPMPPLKTSRRRGQIAKLLADQVDGAEGYLRMLEIDKLAWYDKHPNRPHTAAYQRLVARIEKQRLRVEKAKQMLKDFWANDFVIVMMKGTGAGLIGYQKGLSAKALNATIRIKPYGGKARVRETKNATTVLLTNLEPHTQPVEKRFGVVQAALAEVDMKTDAAVYLRAIGEGRKVSA